MVNPVSNSSAQALDIQADQRQKVDKQTPQNTKALQPPPNADDARPRVSARVFPLPAQPPAQQAEPKAQSKVDVRA